jgi:hypothetical protein
MPNLKGMNVEALMSLRDQVDKRLLECRGELEKHQVINEHKKE